ncbi:MAG: TIGR01777 family oxidoreductase [Myxococcales bacterium]|nr:TIGR01777 family oxidoreductase [Myxococcales bacterium]
MKIVVAGGTGQVGALLRRRAEARGDEVVVLSRRPDAAAREVGWDARTLGPWAQAVDGSDVVINLAGRSVNCRYTKENLAEMMDSRVDSTRVIGQAIAQAKRPPGTWLQMSTATIYAHRFDAANDEATGILGGTEPGVPGYWGYSVEIAKAWERAQLEAETSARKVQLRTAMVMSPDRGGIFDVLATMARRGLGGPVGGGAQYISWIHEADFCAAIDFVIEHPSIEGAVNFTAPNPLPQAEFMRTLRAAVRAPIGLPATRWMAEIGAFVLRTDTELLLKSRRVVPGRLLEAGFAFTHPDWAGACPELAARWR